MSTAVALLAGIFGLFAAGCSSSTTVLTDAAPLKQTKPLATAPRPAETSQQASLTLGAPALPPTAEPGAAPHAPVKVGLMLPLSGPGQAALIADAMKQAAELALKEQNATHVPLSSRKTSCT